MDATTPPDVGKILLATDFSDWTSRAIDYAFEMARCFDAEVLMIHGIEPISGAPVDDEEDDEFDEFFEELVGQARDELDELVERADEREIRARYHIEIGERWNIVLDHAEAEDVDMIVLGRRAQDDQRDLSVNTTSQRVYFGTERPVLTVPATGGAEDEAGGDPGDDRQD